MALRMDPPDGDERHSWNGLIRGWVHRSVIWLEKLNFVARTEQHPYAQEYELVPTRESRPEGINGEMRVPVGQKPERYLNRRVKLPIFGLMGLVAVCLICLGILHIVIVLEGHANFVGMVPTLRQAIPSSGYPTFDSRVSEPHLRHATQDVVPIPCHSHNDYWRKIPLFDAIRAGCTSVEADIWLLPEDDELYVGHDKGSLSSDRTLKGLYLDPLVNLLTRANSKPRARDSHTHGVFETDPTQSLVLMLDFKSDGHTLLPRVERVLEPLRKSGFLSFWDGEQLITRPITLVASGNAPRDLSANTTSGHYIFLDAPLEELGEPLDESADVSSSWNASTAYYASTSLSAAIGNPQFGRLTTSQLEMIRGQVEGAHKRGLKARYWDTPAWPMSLRNHVWKQLLNERCDILNVDDIWAAAFLDWNRVPHNWANG